MARQRKLFLTNDYYWHNRYEINTFNALHPFLAVESAMPPMRGPLIYTHSYNRVTILPGLSSLEKIMAKLKHHITDNEVNELSKLLEADYIFQYCGQKRDKQHETDTLDESRGHIYNYTYAEVRPVMEEIALNSEHLISLFDLAAAQSNSTLGVLLKSLCHLQLDKDEKVDFTGLNLRGASFRKAKLGCSDFSGADTEGVDFCASDLQHCLITQDQLDISSNYTDIKVPADCWGYWDATTRNAILQFFVKMRDYANTNIPQDDPKYSEIKKLCDTYEKPLASGINPNIEIKKGMLIDLQKAKEGSLSRHRNLGFIIKECLAVIALVGVGYAIIASLNWHKSGYFGIFTEPKSHEQVRGIEKLICEAGHRPAARV